MKPALALFVALLLPACASTPAPEAVPSEASAAATDFPNLPADARYVVEKLAACNHFAGEYGGDKSTRDREVSAAIVQLRCETIDEDVRLILLKYPANAELVQALKTATDP